jgi:hypothetical protein
MPRPADDLTWAVSRARGGLMPLAFLRAASSLGQGPRTVRQQRGCEVLRSDPGCSSGYGARLRRQVTAMMIGSFFEREPDYA